MPGILDTIEGFGGCFSPYMFISSITQGIFADDRRSLQEKAFLDNVEFEQQLNERHVQSDVEMIGLRRKWMQERLSTMRKTRAEQLFATNQLNLETKEIEAFFRNYLPISPNSITTVFDTANEYRRKNYSLKDCPLNILLLHTKHSEMNKFITVYDYLDGLQDQIQNVRFPRWCEKNAEHNTAILNIHTIMRNIPTVVISPYFQESTNQIFFTIAMWEAQADVRPLIVPFISINCELASITNDIEKKKELLSKISMTSAIISGCARDIYMLYAFGVKPTLPYLLENNSDLYSFLLCEEMNELRIMVLNEYDSAVKALSSQSENVKSLAPLALNAYNELLSMYNRNQLK